MRVIGKDRTGCDACNPLDEIIARIEQLERRVVTIVARVQGIPPDGTGNVTLPTSDSVDGPLYGNIGAFAMSSEVKEATEDVHQYASAIADDVVVLQSDVEILTREVEALDPASVTALQQSVAALQQSVNQLSNTIAGYSAIIGDLEDQMPNKVDRTGDTMTGPLNVIDTATGSKNMQAVNGKRLQKDLDSYSVMKRITSGQRCYGKDTYANFIKAPCTQYYWHGYPNSNVWYEMLRSTSYERYVILRFVDSVNDYLEAFVYLSSSSVNIVKIASAGVTGRLTIAVARDTVTGENVIYLKTARERNHTCLIESWNRFGTGEAIIPNEELISVEAPIEGYLEVTI